MTRLESELRTRGLYDAIFRILQTHGVTFSEFQSRSRTRPLPTARRKVWLMLKSLGWGSREIGHLFGVNARVVSRGIARVDENALSNRFKRALSAVQKP